MLGVNKSNKNINTNQAQVGKKQTTGKKFAKYTAFDINDPYSNIAGESEDEASMVVASRQRTLRSVPRKKPRKVARSKLIGQDSNNYQLQYDDDLIFLNKFKPE